MNLTKEEMRMNKETSTHHMLNGSEYTGELNEWGYPVGLVFNGCRTEKKVVRTELEAQEGDNLPRYEETLHITYINHWKATKATENEQDRISYILDKEDTEEATLFNITMELYASNLLSRMTVPQLKAHCKERGLKVGGKKADLISRLKEYALQGHDELVGEEE